MQVVPSISHISEHGGGFGGGQRLTVTGHSFGSTKEQVRVDVGNLPCNVVSHSPTRIVCETTTYEPPETTLKPKYNKSKGLAGYSWATSNEHTNNDPGR